jgi:hypothetical protein
VGVGVAQRVKVQAGDAGLKAPLLDDLAQNPNP